MDALKSCFTPADCLHRTHHHKQWIPLWLEPIMFPSSDRRRILSLNHLASSARAAYGYCVVSK